MNKNNVIILFFALQFFSGCNLGTPTSTPKPLPEPESEGAKILVTYCSSCHAAPDPESHAQDEWKNILYRMQIQMTKRAEPQPSELEQTLLLAYLQKYGKPLP